MQKQTWLAWARKSRDMGFQEQRFIISDECYVYLGDTQSCIYVTQHADEVLLNECLVPTFKQSPVHVMVWGCIIEEWKGPLVVLEYPGGKGGGMNSTHYQDQVLEPILKPFYMKLNHERQMIYFQQDNAASYCSKSTVKWLSKNGIQLLKHPASSPDLNPIEPVWGNLKNTLWSHTSPQYCWAA